MNKDYKNIQELFEQILGGSVSLNSNIKLGEKETFMYLIKSLQTSSEVEQKLFEIGNIDLFKVTSPLWDVVELYLNKVFGEEMADIIIWYLFERINEEGEEEPLGENEDGTPFYIKSIEELWEYIINQIKEDG